MIFLFKQLLSIYEKAGKQERKVIKPALEMIRRILIWFGDPPYSADIRGKQLVLPVSHKLPIYIADYPLYDTLPLRITDYLRTRDGLLIMVDIGANVGDTILTCSKDTQRDYFLGVEANPEFVRYLRKNARGIEGAVFVEAFCHSGDAKQAFVRIESVGGTARVMEANDGFALPKKTVDEILSEYPKFKKFNFLKLDTDGNDFDILKGAQESVVSSHPIILMECDVFGNVHYVEDVLSAIASLAKVGYSTIVAYDNFGNYFCTFAASDPSSFLNAIAYQVISEFGYYDLLFLSEKDQDFAQKEKEFFSLYTEKKGLSAIIRKALCI